MKVVVMCALFLCASLLAGGARADTVQNTTLAAQPAVREADDAPRTASARPATPRPVPAQATSSPPVRERSHSDGNLVSAAGCIVGQILQGRAVVNAKSQCLSGANLSAVTRSLHGDDVAATAAHVVAPAATPPYSHPRRAGSSRRAGQRESEQAMQWARQQLRQTQQADSGSIDLLVCQLSGRCTAAAANPMLAANESRGARLPTGTLASP